MWDPQAEGLQHLLQEVIDNSIDEALAGFCDQVQITLHADGSCQVVDNGRGIPVAPHPVTGSPACEVVLTTLHAGGKFDTDTYTVSGGLHGVGISVVNAVGWLVLEVCRNGQRYRQRFVRVKDTELQVVGDAEEQEHRFISVQIQRYFKRMLDWIMVRWPVECGSWRSWWRSTD